MGCVEWLHAFLPIFSLYFNATSLGGLWCLLGASNPIFFEGLCYVWSKWFLTRDAAAKG